MNLRAKVRKFTERTAPWPVQLDESRPATLSQLPPPDTLEIRPDEHGFSLFYLDADGQITADTWHEDVASAKLQALHDYEIGDDEWTPVVASP